MKQLQADYIDADGLHSRQVQRLAMKSLDTRGIAVISGFPCDANVFMELLSGLGHPLTYYGETAGSHPQHDAIHRVRYEPQASSRGELHAVDGPLSIHSAQSLLDPRPRFFCMLMVNSGWQDAPIGQNGESILVPWSDAFSWMESALRAEYDDVRETLLTGVPFPDGRRRGVAYQLASTRNAHDLGVRLKYDLHDYLCRIGGDPSGARAVATLSLAARAVACRIQLRPGDLVMVDNDRWGHGREAVMGERLTADRKTTLNPRELWSVTVA